MTTDLENFVETSRLCSTHEHTEYEKFYRQSTPDVLTNLFDNYIAHDLVSAGASRECVASLLDSQDADIRGRFNGVKFAWDQVRLTGYGQAVQIIAKKLYDIEELTPNSLEVAQRANTIGGQPGERLRLLRDVANLDHVQIDPNRRPFALEMAGQDFFHYDINVFDFCNGAPDLPGIEEELGREISTPNELHAALVTIFDRDAHYAIAIKSQHAYGRTLSWRERGDNDAAIALAALKRDGPKIEESMRLCLGDWCIARIAELSIEHNLPFKMHTGYYATNAIMPLYYIRSGHLCALLTRYPVARFVLMHIAYPYSDELIALAKHYQNVAIDMCWAWTINPHHASDFFLRFINAAPLNKLFVFGGDSVLPASTLGYSIQTRTHLGRALRTAIDEGLFSEADAIDSARRLMMQNVYEYFDVENKKATLLGASATPEPMPGNNVLPGHRVFHEPTIAIRDKGNSPD